MFVWRDCSWRTCKTSSQLLFVCKVLFFPSCRDIGEMRWNSCYPCHHDIERAIIHSILARSSSFLRSLCLCTFEGLGISIATMFAHLCLQLRSSTASWCRASFVSQRSLCGNASDLSLSLFISSSSFSLWFHDTCHLMLFTQYQGWIGSVRFGFGFWELVNFRFAVRFGSCGYIQKNGSVRFGFRFLTGLVSGS